MKKLSMSIKILLGCILLQAIYCMFPNLIYWGVYGGIDGHIIPSLLLYMFSHANWGHLIGNFMFGLPFMLYLERKLGQNQFLKFYILCGLGSALLNQLALGNQVGVIGSSGSIMGIAMAACMLFGRNMPEKLLGKVVGSYLLINQLINIPLYMFFGIAVFGHIGGAVTALIALPHLKLKHASKHR